MAEQSFRIDGGIVASGIVTSVGFSTTSGTSSQFLKADGSVDSTTYSTTDTNTTYSISAADEGSVNKKVIRLSDGSTNDDVIFAGTSGITITRTSDEISIGGTDTTYNLTATDGNSATRKNIRLTAGGTGFGSTDVVLNAAGSISVSRSGNVITLTGTDNNTNTTYTYAAIDGGNAAEKILRLTSSGSVDDDITLVAGSNISLARSGERITITGTDTNTTYSQSAVDAGSGNVNLRLTDGSTNDDILITAGDNITIDSIGANGFRIAADSENDTLLSVTNRGRTTTQGIEVGDLRAGIGTFTSHLTVGGNLTVNGTQTIINSNTLQVGDSQVLLNKDETGAPSQNAGLQVERGTSTNVQLRWNETNDKWEFTNDGTTFQNIPTGNTTYSISAVDGNSGKKIIRLTDSGGGNDDVTLVGGTNVTLSRSNDEITIDTSDSDTTYDLSAVSSSSDIILRLDPSNGSNDDVKIVAGSNMSLTHDSTTQFTIGLPNAISITGSLNCGNTSTGALLSVGDSGTTGDKLIQVQRTGSTTADVNIQAVTAGVGPGTLKLQSEGGALDIGGAVTAGGTINDTAGNVREIVNNTKTGAYTLTANDVGELINTNSNVTIPSGVFSAGQAVTIYNNSGSNITLSRSGVTMYTAGTSTNTDKTLAEKGICTVVCVSSNTFVASGAGMS